MGSARYSAGSTAPSGVLINQFGIIGFYMLMPYHSLSRAISWGRVGGGSGVMGAILPAGMFFRWAARWAIGSAATDHRRMSGSGIGGVLLFAGGRPVAAQCADRRGRACRRVPPRGAYYLAAERNARSKRSRCSTSSYQRSGILLGPLVGLVLLALGFPITVLAAAGAGLPPSRWSHHPNTGPPTRSAKNIDPAGLAVVVRNRPFLTLAAAMTGCYAVVPDLSGFRSHAASIHATQPHL